MNIDLIFKIASIGIVVSVIHRLLVQSGHDEQALMVSIAGLVVVMVIVVAQIKELFIVIKSLFEI